MLVSGSRVVVIALAGVLGACGPVVESMRMAPAPFDPRPADHPVRIYSGTTPRCPFEQVAWLTAEETDFMWNPLMSERTAEKLRERTRLLGGDAIVGFQERIRSDGLTTTQTISTSTTKIDSTSSMSSTELKTDVSPNSSRRLEGVIVRFTNAACTD